MTTAAPLMSEADVILPPPSPVNPIPSLPAALKLDNQEQLLSLLSTDPTATSSIIGNNTTSTFRQVLVFGSESLRTLLLRHVLQEDQTSKTAPKPPNSTKKNWQGMSQFNFPKILQASIVETQVLGTSNNNNNALKQHVDVMTYFLRPWGDASTILQGVLGKIRNHPKVHHRLVFVPQITALVSKVLQDAGVGAENHVTISSLQLDLFPLESDVLSLEYHRIQTPDMPPSEYVTTCARALLKVQDVIGKIPRIQSMASGGEEVLQKLLAMTVEDQDQMQQQMQQQQQQQSATTGSSMQGEDYELSSNNTAAQALPANDLAMLLVDRKVDMVTPMVTPLTYEGLLDEVIGIDCG
jgi:hypothetical protein